MTYEVIISPRALKDIERAYEWLAAQTIHAGAWNDGLMDAVRSLSTNPARCPLVRERALSKDFRQLLYGDKIHAYRIIYTIRGNTVVIARIRHAARHK